jgi:Flp pilus assembly protein TadG
MARLASPSPAVPNRPNRKSHRGAAAVEFAMTAPILFALVLGAVEFSRANMLVHTTSIAATEAARTSIIPGATAPEVRLKALEELRAVGVVDANVTLDPAEIVDDTTQVTVNLTVPVSLRNGYGLSRIFLGRQIFKSVTLQREGKTEDIATETFRADGMQGSSNLSNSMPGNSGNNGGNGNSSNGNSGNGNSGSGSSNSGSGSSSSGSGSGGSSGSSGSGSGSSGSSGSGGFWGALRALLGF